MQGVFEKMQRGANCTRAQRGHFSITCIAFSLLEEQGGVIALAGTLRLPSGLGDSSTVEQRTRFHGRRNCPDGARAAQGVFLVQDQHRRRPAEKAVAVGLWAQHVERTVSGGAPGKRPLDQEGRLPIEGKERDNNRTRIGWPADKPGVPPGFRVLLLVRAGCSRWA